MKYVVILFDGMADLPDEKGETPMSLARKPFTDRLAQTARVGLCATVPDGLKPGSDVANLSVLGYDPRACYTGRSPLEALSMGIPLNENSVCYRCNLVTLSDEQNYADKTMLDYSAGEISTEEARELIAFVDQKLGTPDLQFHGGISYRHCLKRPNGRTGAVLTPPHDISDKKIANYLPEGAYAEQLRHIQQQSYQLLKDHPVNVARKKKGQNPANSVWLWGEGTKPQLQNFTERTGLRGAMISAVDLLKGIAVGAGMTNIHVAGATGNLHTDFCGKAQAAVQALQTHDFVYIHIEAPDECGHQGDKTGKTRAIELIDEKVVSHVCRALDEQGEPYRLLILPDHPTPYTLKTHTAQPVPFLLFDAARPQSGVPAFTEKTAAQTGNFVTPGHTLIQKLIER